MPTATATRPVVVAGAGTMGSGIAQVFAASGRQVLLVDPVETALKKGLGVIEKSLGRLVDKGTIDSKAREETLRRISVQEAGFPFAECAIAVEAVPERPDLKKSVFQMLDQKLPPGAILATNTSSISVTELAAATRRPARFVGMHFMNPVPIMQLVEIVRGLETSDETVAETVDLARALGKVPVVVADRPGFVSNRVLMPMINEAAFALMEGVADREAIDTVMKLGMNHPMGPLALADLIGIDVCLDIMEVLHRGFGDSKYRACPLLRQMVAAGRLGRKSGRGFYEYP
ncbi:MAG: 3-hydroxybutyryl-CoA dehydrogenase [Candidatus Eisenbacteria bacterium]|uniref:3-hydroxybutyryl-CoA dehydrogenase n=1 Tax=Eiseniibacteriota bacterium TaxID=2212470 RepID=A0A538TPS8_UNCEI|nr:MAG: 3-hydroxybutyryl-CoA dehydrogenase [Candidatus Eisenbacteria bacterium]